VLWFRIGFNADLYLGCILMQFRIQGAKPMLIHVDPDPVSDPGQTLKAQKV
jgi:hypothetical protein